MNDNDNPWWSTQAAALGDITLTELLALEYEKGRARGMLIGYCVGAAAGLAVGLWW